MMQPLKSKARISLPKMRSRKHEKNETNEPEETTKNQSHSHHHSYHGNPLFILTKMKKQLQVKSKKDDASVPVKTLAHSESKLKEVFARFDVDKDGLVDAWDLGSLVRALGGNPTQAELDKITTREKLYAPFDFNRFVNLVEKYFLDGSNPEQEVQRAFEVLDADSDGYVSVSDLKMLLTTSGEKLDSAEFDQWIQEVEVGPDGKVRYEDVIKTL